MTSAKRDNSRGFTVIELMVVTLIIAILMSIAFKISGIGDETEKRSRTVAKLQKLENCLSGYYAVYGSYPPVPLQGVSRSIDVPVNKYGVQSQTDAESTGSRLDQRWNQVRAACLAQPVGVKFPFPEEMNDYIKELSDIVSDRVSDDHILKRGFQNVDAGWFSGNIRTKGSKEEGKSIRGYAVDWTDCQIFRYGLLSFLLPRYMFMMGGDEDFYTYQTHGWAQWNSFNRLPANVENGKHGSSGASGTSSNPFNTWSDVISALNYDPRTGKIRRTSGNRERLAMVEAIPSQSVCRRWLANLEGIVSGGDVFYGIDTRDPRHTVGLNPANPDGIVSDHLFSVPNGSMPYVLNEMTVKDGWGNPIFYYSEAPYQSYRLWSSGSNGRTFPPWISVDSLGDDNDKKTALRWMADDITIMSN